MNVAIQQAKKRELAAMEWRKRNTERGGGSPPKSGSDCGTPEPEVRRRSPRIPWPEDEPIAAASWQPPPGPVQPPQSPKQQPQLQPQQQPQQQHSHMPPPPP